MKKKCIRLEIRLTDDEAQMFQNKAKNYGGNVSAMVRDAVRQFDDKRTRGKIETMEALLQFYKKYHQQLSWLGGNFVTIQFRPSYNQTKNPEVILGIFCIGMAEVA